MLNHFEIIETINMIDKENLDIRTITMGISLKSCAGPDIDVVCQKVYDKITTYAKDLVKTGEDIEAQFGIPIVNKRISVTPIATLVDALDNPTIEKAVKIAISIGQDADDDVLLEFTGNRELVLQANNPTALVKMIKWASTTASMVSAPSSKPMNSAPVSTPAGVAPADDPFAPANNGAPLVLDMSNIPNPDDFDEGAVW